MRNPLKVIYYGLPVHSVSKVPFCASCRAYPIDLVDPVFLILQRELAAKKPNEFNDHFLKTALSAAFVRPGQLAARGYSVSKKTVERDLVNLSTIFPVTANEESKPQSGPAHQNRSGHQ